LIEVTKQNDFSTMERTEVKRMHQMLLLRDLASRDTNNSLEHEASRKSKGVENERTS
jgi:hypothetical protein